MEQLFKLKFRHKYSAYNVGNDFTIGNWYCVYSIDKASGDMLIETNHFMKYIGKEIIKDSFYSIQDIRKEKIKKLLNQ